MGLFLLKKNTKEDIINSMFPLYDEGQEKGVALVTILLIVANTAIFFFSLSNTEHFIKNYGLLPENILTGQKLETIFSSMFLHGGVIHLVSNMWFLWIFGDNLEKRLGWLKFLIFYLTCGFFSAFIYCLFAIDSKTPVVGASGAISGILGGYLMTFPRNKIHTLIPWFFIFYKVAIPSFIFLVIWFIIQFFTLDPQIATTAHISGFIIGFFTVKLFDKK